MTPGLPLPQPESGIDATGAAPAGGSASEAPAETWWRKNVQLFLEHHFAPFMVHAIFQLMAILLAFLLAGIWQNYKDSIKDAGSRWIIFRSINAEISPLKRQLEELQARVRVEKLSGPRCVNLVIGTKFETPVWDNLILSDRYLLLPEPPREDLWKAYAGLKGQDMVNGCTKFLQDMTAIFQGLERTTEASQAKAKQDWSRGSSVFTVAEVGLGVFGSLVLLVFFLPMLSRRTWGQASRTIPPVPAPGAIVPPGGRHATSSGSSRQSRSDGRAATGAEATTPRSQ